MYLQKNCKFINLQLDCQKVTPFGDSIPPNGHSGDFEINRPIRYQIIAKRPQTTDGQMNRWTDGQTSPTTTIGSCWFFFQEKKNLLKTEVIAVSAKFTYALDHHDVYCIVYVIIYQKFNTIVFLKIAHYYV